MDKLKNFGPIYLINLKDQTERLANAKSQFNKYGITDYTIIEAVDGRNDDLSSIISGTYPRLKPSEIGCVASHIKALKYWLDTSDSEYAVIIEDDFSFDTVEHWNFSWDDVIDNIPASAEIVQMIMIKNEPLNFNLHKKQTYKKENIKTYEWSTACYLIKRSYAKSLVKIHYKDKKYVLKDHGFTNQAADVVLYALGNAYCMPIFTHIVDVKNSINKQHNVFHTKSKNSIDNWWKLNGKKYDKDKFFDLNSNLSWKGLNGKGCFCIFHVESDDPKMKTRNVLVKRAKDILKNNFDELDTPTKMIKNKEDVKKFYKKENISIDPKGFEGNGWKVGELGIWASNYLAWKNFLDSDYEYLVLMEDDIVLNKNFNEKLSYYISQLPKDWDAFTAFIPETGNVRYNKNNKNLFIDSKDICRVYQSWSCLCYIVSRKGAEKLLEEVKSPVSSPIDHYLFYHKNLNVYSVKLERSNICDIYPSSSTVQLAKKEDMTGWV